MSETECRKVDTLKEYELFFDSVSLKLFTYAYFALGDKESAQKLVGLSFVKGYKEASKASLSEKKIIEILTKELIKSSDSGKLLFKCASYLYFKERFSIEEIAFLLSCEREAAKEMIISFGEKLGAQVKA